MHLELLIAAGFVLIIAGFIWNIVLSRLLENTKRLQAGDMQLIKSLTAAIELARADTKELHTRCTLAMRYATMDDEHHWREFEATKVHFGLDPSYQYCIASVRSMNLSRALAEKKL